MRRGVPAKDMRTSIGITAIILFASKVDAAATTVFFQSPHHSLSVRLSHIDVATETSRLILYYTILAAASPVATTGFSLSPTPNHFPSHTMRWSASSSVVVAAVTAIIAATIAVVPKATALVVVVVRPSAFLKTSTAASPPPLVGAISSSTSTALFVTDVPYGEDSRKYRRTVYSHDDWVKHRSPDRFWNTLATTTKSGIYKVRAGRACNVTCNVT